MTYFNKKLDTAQRNYSTFEKELLPVVWCFKEYQKILYGALITCYTNYKNLTFRALLVQRMLWWRTYLDEFDLELKFVKGKNYVLADAFSRLPRMDGPIAVTDGLGAKKDGTPRGSLIDFKLLKTPKDNFLIDGNCSSLLMKIITK